MTSTATKLNWKPIQKRATEAAEALGHKLEPFGKANRSVRSASCETCYGCCWVAHSPTRGYSAGGRILKYRCGTNEAMGLL